MSGLIYQQKLVFDRAQQGNEKIMSMNEAIRGRANFVTAASTAIVGLITAAKFLPAESSGSNAESLLLAAVYVASIAIYWLAALVWKGGETALT